jgi:hypothetical protein
VTHSNLSPDNDGEQWVEAMAGVNKQPTLNPLL